jgi:hypothetical protein
MSQIISKNAIYWGMYGGSIVVCQTFILQSWVQIWHLPSPQLTANLLVGCPSDGTWLRADLCEGRQRRKLRTAGSPKTFKERKKICFAYFASFK